MRSLWRRFTFPGASRIVCHPGEEIQIKPRALSLEERVAMLEAQLAALRAKERE